jgi:splicing factor 3B subunit 5
MAADRFSINKSFESVANKFGGTGHPDEPKFEWAVNQHRDTVASHTGNGKKCCACVRRVIYTEVIIL